MKKNSLKEMQEHKRKWTQLTQQFHSLAEESLSQRNVTKRIGTFGIFATALAFLGIIIGIIELDVTVTTVNAVILIIPWLLTLWLFNKADEFLALAVDCEQDAVSCKLRELSVEFSIITLGIIEQLKETEGKKVE